MPENSSLLTTSKKEITDMSWVSHSALNAADIGTI